MKSYENILKNKWKNRVKKIKRGRERGGGKENK